jgi:hypothetical protein
VRALVRHRKTQDISIESAHFLDVSDEYSNVADTWFGLCRHGGYPCV